MMSKNSSEPDQTPTALLLLCGALLLLVQQLCPAQPWSPPFVGRARSSPTPPGTWEIVFDSRGWNNSNPLASFLPTAPSRFPEKGLWSLSEDGVHSLAPSQKSTRVGARASVFFARETLAIEAELFQNRVGVELLSGPLTVELPSELFHPESPGVGLDILRLLPSDVERVLLVDTRAVRLPSPLLESLTEQWKRWEFEPHVSLRGAFASPFCYAKWKGETLLLSAVSSPSEIQQELERRFPSSVIQTTSRWSRGSRIVGFQEEKDPAWYFWGDFLVATPSGGIERLVDLQHRGTFDHSFYPRDPFYAEFQRFAEQEKGWHLCIIERPAEGPFHWAALLRWTDAPSGQAEGYLIVEVQEPKVKNASEGSSS